MSSGMCRAMTVSLSAICVWVPFVSAEPAGRLWASDCLTKVMRETAPIAADSGKVEMAGARGEIVSGQAVFTSRVDLENVSVIISDLRHAGSGRSIPAGAVRLQWLRYIDVSRNTKGIPEDELIARAPTSIPDPFWEDAMVSVRADTNQPIWVEVHIPQDAAAGDYVGELTVAASDWTMGLPVALCVWSFEMPADRHLSVVNWWQFPGLGFRDRIKPYSEEYWALLAKACRFLVEHRQTDVLAHMNLIQEDGDEKNGYTYDSSHLEHYADIAFEAGIRQIQLHSVGKRTGKLGDPESRIDIRETSFRRLAALEKLIQRRAWQGRFAVSVADEPFVYEEESYAEVVNRVHQAAPAVRCIEAVEAEYFGQLDIYVPKLSHLNLWYPHFDRVRGDGAELWFYTCCHPVGRYPNRFLDQSLLKVRVLHWMNYLYDLDGYLHWGLNFFHGDDAYSEEGISHELPLGDRAIAYPGRQGFLGSLRFSAQRDGLQDYEYLWVLEDRLASLKQRVGQDAFWLDPRQRPLELCRRVVWSFHNYTRDDNVLLGARRAVAEEIEALASGPLLVVQTSPPEGAVVPAGPRHIIVRGLVEPGAAVTLNGKPVADVRPSGYFHHAYFVGDGPGTITVRVDRDGQTRQTARTFKLTD